MHLSAISAASAQENQSKYNIRQSLQMCDPKPIRMSINATYAINFYIKVIIDFGYRIVDLIQSFDIIWPHIFRAHLDITSHRRILCAVSLDPNRIQRTLLKLQNALKRNRIMCLTCVPHNVFSPFLFVRYFGFGLALIISSIIIFFFFVSLVFPLSVA